MKSLLVWMLLAQGGDLATTGVALSRGCQEVAPIYRSMPYAGTVAVKGGATFVVTFTLGKKPSKGSKAVIAGLAASGTVATVLNLRALPSCRR